MPKKKTDSNTGQSYYQIPRAWYFYDNLKDEFLIDYEFPSELLAGLIQKLGLASNPLCILGYSQGGYLAPFVGAKLAQTKHVIGVNCRYREDLLPAKLNFRLDAFHAQEDTQVDYQNSLASFELLNSRSIAGEFYTWPNKDHELDEQTNAQLMGHIKDYRDLLVK
jgi:predicted esterase